MHDDADADNTVVLDYDDDSDYYEGTFSDYAKMMGTGIGPGADQIQDRNPASRNSPFSHSPLSPEIAKKLVADLSQEDIANDRFSGVKPSTTTFRPDELLSEHQVRKQAQRKKTSLILGFKN